jgi:4-carboxymuconolactone decarboxylase
VSDDQDHRDRGADLRRQVLGDIQVDRAVANTAEYTAEFRDLMTRYAWGEIWARPGLDLRTRSAVTIAALTAGGYEAELAIHVRAALRNGLTTDEIKEVLIHTSVYCGAPAAQRAFAVAQTVLNEPESDTLRSA